MKKPILRWLLLLVAVASCSTDTGPKTGNAGPPARLSFSQQPTNAVKDTAFVNPIKVQLLDQNGQLTQASDNVTLALGVNPKNSGLTGTLTVAAVSGVATFPGLKLDSVGTGYRLVATSGALPVDTSNAFAVTLSLKDFDGDGYSPNQGDCNDADSTVHPTAVDFPDPNHVDANCDGIDGDKSVAVFVATTGFDSAGCGTMVEPCQSVKQGVLVAQSGGKRDVYVAAGAYAGFTAADGINVFGGFDNSWNRSVSNVVTLTGHMQVVAGVPDSGAVTVIASGLTKSTVLADLTLVGAAASGVDASGAGRNSYVVFARDVTGPGLQVIRSHLILGHGSDGVAGGAGVDAGSLAADSAMNGGVGVAAKDSTWVCNNITSGAGGTAGAPEGASGGSSRAAGAGGNGGTPDSACDFDPFNLNVDYTAQPGAVGNAAAQTDNTHGHGGAGGLGASTCQKGTDGEPGLVTNGAAGDGGSGGSLVSGAWRGKKGGDGQLGDDGGGGGGGGGAGGCDTGTDSWGAGGGGGGAGGVAAKQGGGGGAAGGGAFGIYVLDAVVIANADSILGGTGGKGGDGGVGGQGQSGGAGGAGGDNTGTLGGVGGAGGAGGHGGHAGGGGGGAGGPVFGIYVATVGSMLTNTGNLFAAGTAGAGGSGGLSAPGAPVGEQDGTAGKQGAAGAAGSAGSCSAPGGC